MGKSERVSTSASICEFRRSCGLSCSGCVLANTRDCSKSVKVSKRPELGRKSYHVCGTRDSSYVEYFGGYVLHLPYNSSVRIR